MGLSSPGTGESRPLHIAILATSVVGLQPVIRYLEKRNWRIKAFETFNELAKYTLADRPDFIMVSFSINLPEIIKYPQIIWNKFQIPVIPFAETTDNHTVSLLRSFGADAILPPISGALVYSKILSHGSSNLATNLLVSNKPQAEESITVSSKSKTLNENRSYGHEEREFFNELENSLASACEAAVTLDTPVTKTKKLTVLPISDGMFTGLLVFVMGDEDSVDPMLINAMREKLGNLNTFIKFDGIVTKSLNVEIDEVDFHLWTSHKAKFVSRAQHRGKEVMMAFFEMDRKIVEVTPSIDPNMSKINIESITPNVSIDFDAYLYLQSNQKFLKYLHTGTRVSKHQIDSLKERQIDAFHINKTDHDTYQVYVTRNYLNGTITSDKSFLKNNTDGEE